MSKLSIGFNDTGIKGFLAHHVEKIALGIAVLLLAVLFATGYTSPTVKEKQTPAELASLAEAARVNINRDSWEILKDERATDTKHVSRVESARTRISSVNYSAPLPLLSPTMPEIVKRSDPELMAPRLPEVSPLYGVYARVKTTRDTAYRDPLWDSKQAIDIPDVPVRRPTRPRRGRDEEEDELGGLEGELDPAEQPTAKTIPSNYARRLGIAGGEYGGMDREGPSVSTGTTSGVLEGFYGVVFKALVPIEAQTLEYLDRFENAEGYSPSRDIPRYVAMEIYRADVTDLAADADVPEDKWKPLTNSRYAAQYAQLWGKGAATNSGVGDFERGPSGDMDGGEMVDARYLDPIMTFPLPAMLLKPEGDEMLHSETPLASALEDDGDDPSEGLLEIDDLPPIGEGPTDIGDIGVPTGLDSEEDYRFGPDGEYGENLEPVPYRLIRYTDTTVQPGRKYRYRTRVYLYDPNSLITVGGAQDSYTAADGGRGEFDGASDGGASGLNESMLEEEVLQRLKAREAKTLETGKPNPYISTPWSDPSPVVSVPARPEKVLAGSVVAATKVVNGDIRFERGEPSAKLAAVIWSKKRTVDMPAEKEVMRGSFLNFRAQTDVIHPQLLMVRRLTDEHFDLDSMVLDIRGGERLPRSSSGSDPLTAPGELLLIDRDGNLIVRSEVEDAEEFRDYLLMEAVPPPPEPPEDEFEDMDEEQGRFGRGFRDS